MSEYVSVRAALLRDIEGAEAALAGANDSYRKAEVVLRQAQSRSSMCYEGLVKNQKNVERLQLALSIIKGAEDE